MPPPAKRLVFSPTSVDIYGRYRLPKTHVLCFYDLPVTDAARILGVCRDSLRRIRAWAGATVWPYDTILNGGPQGMVVQIRRRRQEVIKESQDQELIKVLREAERFAGAFWLAREPVRRISDSPAVGMHFTGKGQVSTVLISTARLVKRRSPMPRIFTDGKATDRKATARISTQKKSTDSDSTARISTQKKSTDSDSTARISTQKKSTDSDSTAQISTQKISTAQISTQKISTAQISTQDKSTDRQPIPPDYYLKPSPALPPPPAPFQPSLPLPPDLLTASEIQSLETLTRVIISVREHPARIPKPSQPEPIPHWLEQWADLFLIE